MITIFDRIGRTFIRLSNRRGSVRCAVADAHRTFGAVRFQRVVPADGARADSIRSCFCHDVHRDGLGRRRFSGFQRVHAEQSWPAWSRCPCCASSRRCSAPDGRRPCVLVVAAEIGTIASPSSSTRSSAGHEPIQYCSAARDRRHRHAAVPVILGDALAIYGGYAWP